MNYLISITVLFSSFGFKGFAQPPIKPSSWQTDSVAISKMWYCCGPLIKVEDADTIRFNSLNNVCGSTNHEYFVWEFESSGQIAYHSISRSDGVYITLSEGWNSETGKLYIGKIEFEIITLTAHDFVLRRVK